MHTPRIYVAQTLVAQSVVVLDEAASHHLLRVLRVRQGDAIVVFNGEGTEYPAHVVALSKRAVTVELVQAHTPAVESRCDIHLLQGISRGERMDYVIQKAVELGVSQITPLLTERCNVRLDEKRWEKRYAHWRKVVISATEQSGRCKLAQLNPVLSLNQDVNVTATLKWVCHLQAHSKAFDDNVNVQSVAVMIGPEGGLTEAEVDIAHQAGFADLSLGPRVLRTETAPIVALSLIHHHYGDLV